MITTSIIYDHRNRAGQNAEGAVEIRIICNRKAYYINTGIKVLRSQLIGGTIVNRADAPELNQRLITIYTRAQEEVNAYLAEGRIPDAAEIKRRVWGVAEEGGEPVLDFIEEQIGMLRLAEGTIKHYRTTLQRLREYGRIVRWSDVTAEELCKFDAWLHQLKKTVTSQGGEPECISDAGVYNYHKTLKAMLNKAVLFGRLQQNPYILLRGKFARGDSENLEFLTEAEMKAVESLHPVAGTQMAIARDLFVFQMHTGLSYADTQAFDFSQYYKVDGRWCTVSRRVKTGVEYVIQLSAECERILQTYGWGLPKIDNSDYNNCLKALGAAVGIEKRMHTHLARHSFGTYMAANNIPIQNVKKMMGHKDIKQTLRYAKVLPESVFADFKKIERKKE